MKLHRFIIKPTSPWGTQLRSDTLSGLLLCQIAERNGDAACQKAIEGFEQGDPPFVVSSVMPQSMVCSPKLPPIPRHRFRQWIEEGRFKNNQGHKLNIYEVLREYKNFRKRPYLSLSEWQEQAGNLSVRDLFSKFCALPTSSAKGTTFSQDQSQAHVTISRQNNMALDGELFFSTMTYFAEKACFHLYVRTDDKNDFLGLIREVGSLGFGKDASTGKGRFEVSEDSDFEASKLDGAQGQASLLLSVCSSMDMADLNGWYSLEVKRGKAAPQWSNPFKKPVLLVQEGSVLFTLPKNPYVLKDIHTDAKLVQITHPLTLPCQLARED